MEKFFWSVAFGFGKLLLGIGQLLFALCRIIHASVKLILVGYEKRQKGKLWRQCAECGSFKPVNA